LRLRKLEIYGFKSFADHTEITFEHGITGIVGPNGCGKSNIADAVRWVLGEQSVKSLRGGKMEDVIFGGTEKRRRLSYCEVILTFDNEDRALPLDYHEIAVSRRCYRSGESEYCINKTPCRLRDVLDLFRDTGIGKDGYSIIGQGRIDEILSVRSEDRRQVFEEAAGIGKFKLRKLEAQRRMEKTADNLIRVDDILSELEARVEPLRAQSETAREYLQLREELKGLELNVFLLRTERYSERIKGLSESLEGMRGDQQRLEEARALLSGQRDEAQERLGFLEAEAASGRESVQALIADVEAREGAVAVLKERNLALARDRQRYEEQLSASREGSSGIQRQLEDLSRRIEEAREKERELSLLQQTAEAGLAEKERALAEKEQLSESLKAEVIDAMNRLSDVRSERARLSAMEEQINARLAELKEERDSGADLGQSYLQQVREARQQLSTEQAEKQRLEGLSAAAVQRVKELGERAEALSQTISDQSAQVQETGSRLKMLEEMQRDYEGYQFSVKNVLMQARRMPGSGVHGVVATLIRVPRELERAVDVVLGPALQNIVVEREEDAKAMIEYLKKGRLGRATFLPLSAVKGRTLNQAERQLLTMPGCLGVASELIEFEPKYQGVVQSLLGRTLIARDLDAGIAIMRAGRHAFRLVTLEGDVMNPGGAMTGGSLQSRMTSLLSREREVTEHRQRLASLQESLEKASREMEELDEARSRLKQERAQLFDQLHQQDIACTREEAHLAAAQAELEAHSGQALRIEEAIEQLESQLTDIGNALNALEGRESGEDEQKSRRQEHILDLSREISLMREELEELRRRTGDSRVALTACTRDLQALTGDRERLSRQKNDAAKLALDSEHALANCSGQLAQLEKQLKEEESALVRARDGLNRSRGAFRAIDEQRIQVQETLKKAGDDLEAMRSEQEALSDRVHRSELQKSNLEAEFRQLTDRIWEDYELSYEGALPFRDEGFKLTDSEKRVAQIKGRIKSMGSVNVGAVDEYRETMERFTSLNTQRDDLLKARVDLEGIVEDLTRQMERQFKAEFAKLNGYFQQTFVKLFGGGQAELRLTDPKDALECGIEIVAQPPGKKLQMLSLLSGGERALTAIAILFAMLTLKPTPFCFLDEIEAALDDANIENFAEYLRDFSKKTQFVVVTHRKGTMEKCDGLYGVAMQEKGVSRLVSVRLSEAQQSVME
jgi:chromosome segregation protein